MAIEFLNWPQTSQNRYSVDGWLGNYSSRVCWGWLLFLIINTFLSKDESVGKRGGIEIFLVNVIFFINNPLQNNTFFPISFAIEYCAWQWHTSSWHADALVWNGFQPAAINILTRQWQSVSWIIIRNMHGVSQPHTHKLFERCWGDIGQLIISSIVLVKNYLTVISFRNYINCCIISSILPSCYSVWVVPCKLPLVS